MLETFFFLFEKNCTELIGFDRTTVYLLLELKLTKRIGSKEEEKCLNWTVGLVFTKDLIKNRYDFEKLFQINWSSKIQKKGEQL